MPSRGAKGCRWGAERCPSSLCMLVHMLEAVLEAIMEAMTETIWEFVLEAASAAILETTFWYVMLEAIRKSFWAM